MASTHPSVFELHAFVSRGETSPDFERHVSACASCAARLTSFSARVAAPALVVEPPVERHLRAAGLALVACLAVLVVRTVTLPRLDGPPPEGVHGVSSGPLLTPLDLDAGPADSGVLSPPS